MQFILGPAYFSLSLLKEKQQHLPFTEYLSVSDMGPSGFHALTHYHQVSPAGVGAIHPFYGWRKDDPKCSLLILYSQSFQLLETCLLPQLT